LQAGLTFCIGQGLQLPVPDELSDCISELHDISRMQTEIDAAIARFQLAATFVNGSLSFDPRPSSSSEPSAILPSYQPKSRNALMVDASTTATMHTFHHVNDGSTNAFTPKLSGFTALPYLQQVHLASATSAATTPAIDYLESPAVHKLSAISHVTLTQRADADEKVHPASNFVGQDAFIEDSKLFATPAQSSRALPSSHTQFRRSANVAGSDSLGNSMQRDYFLGQSSTPRVLAANTSVLDSSGIIGLTPELGPHDHFAAKNTPGDSARKLTLKLIAMDAKNREIDSMLAQFLKQKSANMNDSGMQGSGPSGSTTLQKSISAPSDLQESQSLSPSATSSVTKVPTMLRDQSN
jgi:hypothetical protein